MLIGCTGHTARSVLSDNVAAGSLSQMARTTPTQLNNQQLLAESLHILRPLFHRIHSGINPRIPKSDDPGFLFNLDILGLG